MVCSRSLDLLPFVKHCLVGTAFVPAFIGSLLHGRMAEKILCEFDVNLCNIVLKQLKYEPLLHNPISFDLINLKFVSTSNHYPTLYSNAISSVGIDQCVCLWSLSVMALFPWFEKATLMCLWACFLGGSRCCAILFLSNERRARVP